VEGWRPVEDIVRWGFGQAPVVMANEFHSGLGRTQELLEFLADTLAALGGTAGIRRVQAESGPTEDGA
jgi:hypothetical protein